MIPDTGDMLMDNGSLIAAAAISPSPHQQKQIIENLTNNSISRPAYLFFLVSNRWFTEWKKYTGFGAYPDDEVLPEPHLIISDAADRPGPIDNSNIVSTGSNSEGEDLQLLDNLEEERDYVLVSQDVWEKLFEWYKGGPVLPRKMISVGVRQELVVEVYPLCLKVIDARDRSVSTIRLSKKASLHELHERVCSVKRTDSRKVRIWDYFNNRKQTLLEDSTKTLEEFDLQMNQSILLEVQVDGILATGLGMDSGFDMDSSRNDIEVRLVIFTRPRVTRVSLKGFTSSDTINVVVDKMFREVKNINLGFRDCGKMMSPVGFPLDYNETLQSLLDLGYGDWSTYLSYVPGLEKESPKVHKLDFNWLSICERVRLREEAHMENIDNPVSIVRRPKSLQFALFPGLGVHGQYKLLDSNNSSLPDASIGFAASVQTNASIILLAPNDKILKHLISLNGKSKYLVVGVTWDKWSYLFLRTLRASYPDLPIVAVTDLDPHHLDLLTFLDTPLINLPGCYGWDLSGESRDENIIDYLNIRWLGLRPYDCQFHVTYDSANRYPSGFREVIHMLRANPFFRRKKHWLAALDWLEVFGTSVTFHPLAPSDSDPDCHVHLGDSFIAKQLFRKDWV
ncbi:hypothetical protein POM88_053818 [Heracleum sosnowskyi]|uniref:DUSP domain-containing protein n=1 Tax=Heracleum sosnowskyi TaxID=360622 RepID=A0AAD8GN92_9APIA|nr:hypothetical protein POM88_053818 [Heracleum sosnowskyi]